MNIAIISCNKMTYECCGSGCFKSFNNKTHSFEIYKDKDIKLYSFFHCNGCGSNLETALDYKLTQLKKSEVEQIHMAKCIEVECSRYDEIKTFLINKGFKVIDGTH